MSEQDQRKELVILLDESHLWGVLFFHALDFLKIPFALVRSSDIASGFLQKFRPKGLLVPGGWASKKAKSLGRSGKRSIDEYVQSGGTYLGFCGGAGLALQDKETESNLGLCPWKRKSINERLPNCSGHVYLKVEQTNSWLPDNLGDDFQAPIWWPSQFKVSEWGDEIKVLARYLSPGDDFWVADLPFNQLDNLTITLWENLYRINLDFDYLAGEPAAVWGDYGLGGYFLSYLHLETPNSIQANMWLQKMMQSILGWDEDQVRTGSIPDFDLQKKEIIWAEPTIVKAIDILEELISLGRENFLLCWRKPWLLGWKRGMPGFCLNTLYAMLVYIQGKEPGNRAIGYWSDNRTNFWHYLTKFADLFRQYLINERFCLYKEIENPEYELCQEKQNLREKLTGPFPGQGGIFGKLTAILQELLWRQLENKKFNCL